MSDATNAKRERAVESTEGEVVAFLSGRAVPCPRCGYDLCGIQKAVCPECGEPLTLVVGSTRVRFGWLVVAMVPGSFSGVTAVVVAIPVVVSLWQRLPPGQGAPWPLMVADVFGFVSAAAVVMMYRYRHRILVWPSRKQAGFAAMVWGVHVAMLMLVVLGMVFG